MTHEVEVALDVLLDRVPELEEWGVEVLELALVLARPTIALQRISHKPRSGSSSAAGARATSTSAVGMYVRRTMSGSASGTGTWLWSLSGCPGYDYWR